MTEDGTTSTLGKWLAGIIATVLGGVITWMVINHLGRSDPDGQHAGQPTVDIVAATPSSSATPYPSRASSKSSPPSNMDNLGGSVAFAPAAVSWGPGRMDVYALFDDGALRSQYFEQGRWSGWGDSPSPPPGMLSGPALASRGQGRLDLFVIGKDHALWYRRWDAGAWKGWQSLGSPPGRTLAGTLAAQGMNSLRVNVTAVTTDGYVATIFQNADSWSAWGGLNACCGGATATAAVSWSPDRIDIVFIARDHEVREWYWTGNQWNGPVAQGAVSLSPQVDINTQPAAISLAREQLSFFVLDVTGALLRRDWSASGWVPWSNLGGTWLFGPAATVQNGHIELFLVDKDRRLLHQTL